MIDLQDISYSFKNHKVLTNLNLSIQKGSLHSLIGVTGSGKSLTLKLLSSLLPLQVGKILGRPLNVSFAFQQSPLIPWLTLEQNLSICIKNKDYIKDIEAYLKYFHLENFKNHFPNEVSGGMIQKINILRSFLSRAELILMDEPFVHIDSIQREELHEFTIDLWKKVGSTILFVTHDIDEALFLSNTVSLYSTKGNTIKETFEVSLGTKNNLIEMKKHSNYPVLFNKIYNHLKQDHSL